MATVHANGITQHVQRMGPPGDHDTHSAPGAADVNDGPDRHAAPTVVFVHGLLTDSLASYYFTLAKPIADAGLPVLMYDLRGHGRTDRPPTGYAVDDFVADLAALLDALAVPGRCYLVGNSFGGTIAFGFAARHPDRVAGIVAIESEPATAAWSAKLAGILDRAGRELHRREALAWITLRYGTRTTRLAKSAAALLAATTLAADVPASRLLSDAEIRAIRCPVLAIYGEDSDLAVQAPLLATLLPDCTTTIVAGQQHSVLVEVPHTVRDLLLSWIAAREQPHPAGATP